jgi:hypothetical protein
MHKVTEFGGSFLKLLIKTGIKKPGNFTGLFILSRLNPVKFFLKFFRLFLRIPLCLN